MENNDFDTSQPNLHLVGDSDASEAAQVRAYLAEQERRGIPIWEQLPQEPDSLFALFEAYSSLGPTRSLDAMAHELGHARANSNHRTAAVKYAWVKRAQAYDEYVRVEHARISFDEADEKRLWAQRAIEAREEEYALGSDMMSLVRERLDRADGRELQKDGSYKEITPEPLKVQDKDWPTWIRAGLALVNEAFRQAAKAGEMDGDDADDESGMPKVPTDLAGLSEAEITRLLRKAERYSAGSKTKQ